MVPRAVSVRVCARVCVRVCVRVTMRGCDWKVVRSRIVSPIDLHAMSVLVGTPNPFIQRILGQLMQHVSFVGQKGVWQVMTDRGMCPVMMEKVGFHYAAGLCRIHTCPCKHPEECSNTHTPPPPSLPATCTCWPRVECRWGGGGCAALLWVPCDRKGGATRRSDRHYAGLCQITLPVQTPGRVQQHRPPPGRCVSALFRVFRMSQVGGVSAVLCKISDKVAQREMVAGLLLPATSHDANHRMLLDLTFNIACHPQHSWPHPPHLHGDQQVHVAGRGRGGHPSPPPGCRASGGIK